MAGPADNASVMRSENARVTCTECGFEWFGDSAAQALRLVGSCTRCRGQLRFHEEPEGLPEMRDPAADVPAHLVLGTPRL